MDVLKQQFASKAMVKALPKDVKQEIQCCILNDKTLINEIPAIPVKPNRKAPLDLLYRFTEVYRTNIPTSGVFFNKEMYEAVATDGRMLAKVNIGEIEQSVILTKDGKVIEGTFPNYNNLTKYAGQLVHSDTVSIAPMLGKLKAVSNVWDVLFPEDKCISYKAVYKEIQFIGYNLQKVLQALSDAGNTETLIHYRDAYNPVRFEAGNMEIWLIPARPKCRGDIKEAFLDL